MEPSLPYGLNPKKKSKKAKKTNNNNKINDNNVNTITNEAILLNITLIIRTIMDKNNFYPKTDYFINSNKSEETEQKFPSNLIFEKLFPNFTSYFKNLDQKFSEAIEKKTYIDENNDMSKVIKNFILDQIYIWNNEIVNYIGNYWDSLDKKIKVHTIIFLYMVNEFIKINKLNEYDINILYWAILFHDVGKFHEMNTIYKEDYSKNKFIDKSHPFKSAIVFISTMLNKDLIYFKDEKEKKDFINFFEKNFTVALFKSFEKEYNKYNNLVYNINFNYFTDIEKFLLKLKFYDENKWIYEVLILIIFHQSLPNNDSNLHGRHINEPILDDKYINELFDVHLLELMRIILIYDSSSHCLFKPITWEQKIDKYFDILIQKNKNKNKAENITNSINKSNKVIYLAELDGDVDDVLAVEYLYSKNVLKSVICDPKPVTKIGILRENNLKKLGIELYYEIPDNNDTDIFFCGGALTSLAKYIIDNNHKISVLVMNGGFVGDNIVQKKDRLKKFDGKNTIRTFNFNVDVISTDKILKTSKEKIGKIILVGKNVCHSKKNTPVGIWNFEEFDNLFNKYYVRDEKCLHDMLMCHEGLCLLNLIEEESYCFFEEVYPYNEGLDGEKTKWGSKINNNNTPYRKVLAATKYN